jgi:zeaxanthin glucosyltransferase
MDFDFPWQQLTGEPIVYASMGTLHNALIDIFPSITQAAVGLKELQFVLAVGGQLDPKQLGDVPANVMVVSYAPQIEILKRSSLCITHAGLNTVLESLSSGVPMQPGARRFHGPEQRSESAGSNPERGRSLDCRRYS